MDCYCVDNVHNGRFEVIKYLQIQTLQIFVVISLLKIIVGFYWRVATTFYSKRHLQLIEMSRMITIIAVKGSKNFINFKHKLICNSIKPLINHDDNTNIFAHVADIHPIFWCDISQWKCMLFILSSRECCWYCFCKTIRRF